MIITNTNKIVIITQSLNINLRLDLLNQYGIDRKIFREYSLNC